MNPLLQSKLGVSRKPIDISTLPPEEQALAKKYGGKLPAKGGLHHLAKERKWFDSGDYALAKSGQASPETVGTAIPSPENIPHAASPTVNPPLSASLSGSLGPTTPGVGGVPPHSNVSPTTAAAVNAPSIPPSSSPLAPHPHGQPQTTQFDMGEKNDTLEPEEPVTEVDMTEATAVPPTEDSTTKPSTEPVTIPGTN